MDLELELARLKSRIWSSERATALAWLQLDEHHSRYSLPSERDDLRLFRHGIRPQHILQSQGYESNRKHQQHCQWHGSYKPDSCNPRLWRRNGRGLWERVVRDWMSRVRRRLRRRALDSRGDRLQMRSWGWRRMWDQWRGEIRDNEANRGWRIVARRDWTHARVIWKWEKSAWGGQGGWRVWWPEGLQTERGKGKRSRRLGNWGGVQRSAKTRWEIDLREGRIGMWGEFEVLYQGGRKWWWRWER